MQILNADGSTLYDEDRPYGSKLIYKGIPLVPDSMQEMGYVFTFQSWVNQATDEVAQLDDIDSSLTVGGDVVYKAVYAKKS